MHYAFLTTLVPDSLKEEVSTNASKTMQDAATALELHIHEGLCKNLHINVPVFNVLPISSYPKYYKKCFIKNENFSANGFSNQKNIGFCNLKGVRVKSKAHNVYRYLDKWCFGHNGEKILFMYTISAGFMSAAFRLKAKYHDLKICAIIADLPNMTLLGKNASWIDKVSAIFLAKKSFLTQGCVDYYVLLTKQMADYMSIKKPFCVMEGIATEFPKIEVKQSSSKTILYAGTLHQKFGVRNLVDAFGSIPDKNFQLIICGVGDSESYIQEKSRNDKRIVFLGRQPRKKILELIQSASVLVNPRQNNEEFTKYSFPSKNLEYLSSGIPFVAYKLDGIPDEYDDYINYVEDNSIETLKNKIIEVAEDKEYRFKAKAQNAVKFVMQEKSAVPQTKKILNLCLSCCEKA